MHSIKFRGLAFVLLGLLSMQAPAGEAGFKSIFNGKDLTGWEGDARFWSVRDGAITGQSTPEKVVDPNTFLVWKQGELDDFELKLKFRIQGDNPQGQANSGIQYRSRVLDPEKFVVGGYQADFEGGTKYSGILYEERGRGILALRSQKVKILPAQGKPKIEVTGSTGDSDAIQAAIRQGDWNDYRIVARGNHLQHYINGHLTIEVVDEDVARRAMSGVLALQMHKGPPMTVQFTDIQLKRFPLAHARKLLLVAGKPSHPPLMHEFNAGVQLLHRCLSEGQDRVQAAFQLNGWPADPTAFDNVDGVLFYMDGGGRHEVLQGDRLKEVEALAARGVGIGCAHYAVETPEGVAVKEFQHLIGGVYQKDFSVNPIWEPNYSWIPRHPVTRGVQPFQVKDEWYFNMRFADNMTGVLPILMAKPSDETRDGPYVYPKGPYAHIQAAKGRQEIMLWLVERADGGRGFGFTGGHFHLNWGDDNYRRLVLNTLVWMAGAEVPPGGVVSEVTEEQLMQNLDPKPAPKPRPVSAK